MKGQWMAMIDSFSISPELTTVQAKYLEYTVTYSDGVELEDKQELKAEATETIKVRFSYIENEDKTNYPTEDQSFNIEFTVNCAQADEESVEIRKELYSISDSSGGITVGDTISSLNNTYKTYEDLVNSTGYNIFLKHKIINEEIIGDTQIGFLNNNQVYYLTGGDYGQSFEDNKTLLKNAFGEENCTLTEPSDEPIPLPGTYEYGVYYCTNANLEVRVTSYGGIIASENDSNYTCYFSAYVNNSFSCPLGTFYLPHPKPY